MPNIDLSILNQRQTPAFFADTLANRPAAGFLGRIFVSTDTFAFYRDNGTGWDLIGGPGTGTITGTGASGQIALWNGASTITGDTGLTYDGTANSLTASKFIVTGGTSSQFLKGDGSLDNTTYNTGSGSASQVAFFNGANSITGENNLWWDSVNNHFGINTNTPGTALDIHHDQSTLVQLNQTTATNDTRIAFQNSGTALWRIGNFYNAGANDWGIFDVVGAAQPFTIKKTTGQTFIGAETTSSGRLVVNNTTGDNHIVVIGATAPSIRVRNAGVSPTRQFGLGLATTTNNFIQGSTGGEFCIFNASTTASPILFGVYDAGAGNTQEAARISAARNFIVGRTTDSGEKLQVLGQSKFLQSSSNIVAIFEGDWDRNATNNNQIYITGSTNTNKQLRIGFDTTSDYGYIQALISGTGLNSIIINPSGGFVGINNQNPLANLAIGGIGGNTSMELFSESSGTNIQSYNRNTSAYGYLRFSTNGETARFTPSANFLIGTTTDAGQKLQVNGDAYVNGLGTFTGANLLSGNQYLRSANVPLPHSTTTTILRFFNNAGNLSGQNAIFGIINIFVGWNAGYNLGSNIYTYSISCSTNGVGVLSLLSSNVVGSNLVTSVTASADGTGCKIDVTTNGTSNPLNANCWVTFSGNFF